MKKILAVLMLALAVLAGSSVVMAQAPVKVDATGVVMVGESARESTNSMVLSTPQGDSIRLFKRACESKTVVDQLKPEYVSKFQAAAMVYNGKSYEACWILTPDGNVVVIDEAGDVTPIPLSMFKVDPGV